MGQSLDRSRPTPPTGASPRRRPPWGAFLIPRPLAEVGYCHSTPCPFRPQCTRAKQEPRIIGLLPREQHEALQAARRRQTTEEFRQQYAARAGIEGTHEQAVRRCGLRRSRYIGQAKAHLQHVLTAAALNVIRLDDWWAGAPVSRTRCSRFAALEQAA
jgi:Transposase DDE domain